MITGLLEVAAMDVASEFSSSAQTISSALKGVSDQIGEKIAMVRKMFRTETKQQFEIGDALIDLVDNCGCKLSFLSEKLERSEGTLSSYISTCRDYPVGVRRLEVPFYAHQITRAAAKRVESRASRSSGTDYKVDLVAALDKTVQQKLKKPHDIVKVLRDEAREILLPGAVAAADTLAAIIEEQAEGILNNTHHMDYRDLVPMIPNGVVQIVHMDPPYCDYAHVAGLNPNGAGSIACDNDTKDTSLAVTVDAFPLLDRILAENGVILLWQQTSGLRPAIGQAIIDNGFHVEIQVIWDKSRPQPGYPDSPWTYQTESLYVIRRKVDLLVNYDGSDRGNIIVCSTVQHRRDEIEETHAYQKPAELCERLVSKHSQKGQIVADLFGCSGEFAIAAHNLSRRWIYCESNEDNFNFGRARIADALVETPLAEVPE